MASRVPADKVWSKYSKDKVDIAHTLVRVIRTPDKSLPVAQPLTALSVGSSNEPQSSRVEFFVDDFERFMGVVWMILLYPNVHHYSREQMVEVIEHVYERLWRPGVPLIQLQDHLVV